MRAKYDKKADETVHPEYMGEKRGALTLRERIPSFFYDDILSPVHAIVDFGKDVAGQLQVAEKTFINTVFRNLPPQNQAVMHVHLGASRGVFHHRTRLHDEGPVG